MTLEKLHVQDGWVVEYRQRQSGVHEGDIYCVFVSSAGKNFYAKSLGSA